MDTNGHGFTWGNERIEHRRKEGAGTDSQKPTNATKWTGLASELDHKVKMIAHQGIRVHLPISLAAPLAQRG